MKNKLNLNLKGQDGNAFALLGYFHKEARKQNWTEDEMSEVTEEATNGDYDHLIQTLMSV